MKKILIVLLMIALALFAGCDNDTTTDEGDKNKDKGGETPTTTTLAADIWTNGNITASNGEQWFKFTANAAAQYIHVNLGTLTNLYVQLYESRSGGNMVGSQANFYGSIKSTSLALTVGQEYYIKVTPNSGSGTYQITFAASATPPMITFTANVWADGNITSSDGEWFKFTATAATQYIHVNFGTLTDLNIQLYDSQDKTVGSQANLFGSTKYASRTLVAGQAYFIKVTPFNTSYRGTYQIAFNTSTTPPMITLPSNAAALTSNLWTDGNITASSGAEWFKFTAIVDIQYIHASFGTMTSLYVQLYDKNGNTVGSQTNLNSAAKYFSQIVTVGQEYYVRVSPFNSSQRGTYQIAFNASATAPTAISLPSNAVTLTVNVLANGNIPVSNGQQWFKFTATAAAQYVHVNFGTLNDMYVQLYDNNGNTVGNQTRLSSTTKYVSRTLTAGQMYYIKVTPYSDSGTYQIAFNTMAILPFNVTTFAANTWTNGNIPVSSGEQWFKFTATAATQYVHFILGTLTYMNVQLYDDSGNTVGSRENIFGSSSKYISRSVTAGQEYYIKVTPYSSSYSGTYQILFNISSTPPVTLPASATQLAANTWTDGNIPTSNGEQWFKFTATAATQYVHISFGTLNDLYVQLYDNGGNTVGTRTELWGSTKYISRTVTVGQEYYIKVTPYSSLSGAYQIMSSTMSILPVNVTTLTAANTWVDGSISVSYSEQWFKFTATAATQYVHISFGTLNDMYVQVYDSNNGNTVGGETNFYSSTKSASVTLTVGQEYYIKVRPYSSYTGTYKIAFNTSSTAPSP